MAIFSRKKQLEGRTDNEKDFEEAYHQAVIVWDQFIREATKDTEAVAGEQWEPKWKAYLKRQRRETTVWNKMSRVVELLTGYERKNRLVLKAEPHEGADEQTAERFSQLLMWNMLTRNGYEVLSDAFEKGPLRSGFNLVQVYMDWRKDPLFGDVSYARWPFNSVLLGPGFERRDLSDCPFIIGRKYLADAAVKAAYPAFVERIKDIQPGGRDTKFYWQPYSQDYTGKDKYRVDQFMRYDTRETWMVVDPQTAEIREFRGNRQQLDEFMRVTTELMTRAGRQPYKTFRTHKQYVRLTIMVEGKEFYDGPDVNGLDDEYPFVFLGGHFDPEIQKAHLRIQSLVRSMRDPQAAFNKLMSQTVDIIESQINAGVRAVEGSFLDPRSAYQSGQGVVQWLKRNAGPISELVQDIQPANIPQGFFQLGEAMANMLVEIPGANSELFGMPENEDVQVAGILSKMRQAAGLTILQKLFDHFRQGKIEVGRKTMKLMQKHYGPGKVQRICGEPPTREFYTKGFAKYDVTTAEGVLTDTQRQQYLYQLMAWKQMGMPIPWSEVIDAASFENKDKLRKAVQQAEQQQMQMMEMQVKEQQLMQRLIAAKTAEEVAGARADNARAREDLADAMLNRIKAAKEARSVDMDSIKKLVDSMLAMDQLLHPPAAEAGGQPQQGGQVVEMKRRQGGRFTRR